jgi:hypothetical protein
VSAPAPGVDPMRIVVVDAPDLHCAFTAPSVLAEDIARHTAGDHTAEITHWTGVDLENLGAALLARSDELDSSDVIVLSAGLALPLDGRSTDVQDWFTRPLAEAVAVLKRHNVFVIVLNASTVDPSETSSSWSKGSHQPSVLVHRLDAALIRLSVLDGISIVDVDRLVAEMGATVGVHGLLDYTPAGGDAVRAEIVRILDDSRFFTTAPVVVQVGRRKDPSEI